MSCRTGVGIDVQAKNSDRRTANELVSLRVFIGLHHDPFDLDGEIQFFGVGLDESDRSLGIPSALRLENGDDSFHLWRGRVILSCVICSLIIAGSEE